MARELIGVYPGTFDPMTNGHMDIITRARRLVDVLVIGVAVNSDKAPMFALEQRVAMVREELHALGDDGLSSVEVRPFDNLLTQFAQDVGASIILRGLRAVSDFDFEFQMVGMNARLNPQVETVFLMASEGHHIISSRLVKEIAWLGGEVSHFVSPNVANHVAVRLASRDAKSAARG